MQKKNIAFVSAGMKILNVLQQKLGLAPEAGLGPAAILAAIDREMRARRKVFLRTTLVPDNYRVELARRDYDEIRPFVEMFCRELRDEALQLVRKYKARIAGDRVTVDIVASDEPAPGSIKVTGSFTTPVQDEPAEEAVEGTAGKISTVRLEIAAEGNRDTQTRTLAPGAYIIGRGPEADIVPRIEDDLMSRNHCLLTIDARETVIQDLDSTNGILFNGERISHARLAPGDRFQLGDTRFTLIAGPEE